MGKPLLPFIRGDSYLANNRGYIPCVVGNGYTSDFAAGVLSVLCVSLGFGDHMDKIIIGTIMLEIPGLSFGNALRDMLCGDTLAGTMRFIQTILQALMIALGYMAALVLFNQQIGG